MQNSATSSNHFFWQSIHPFCLFLFLAPCACFPHFVFCDLRVFSSLVCFGHVELLVGSAVRDAHACSSPCQATKARASASIVLVCHRIRRFGDSWALHLLQLARISEISDWTQPTRRTPIGRYYLLVTPCDACCCYASHLLDSLIF